MFRSSHWFRLGRPMGRDLQQQGMGQVSAGTCNTLRGPEIFIAFPIASKFACWRLVAGLVPTFGLWLAKASPSPGIDGSSTAIIISKPANAFHEKD
jgi:hypothetical protein